MRLLRTIAAAAMLAMPASAQDVMVVFDGSNSMWGQIEGTAKIEIAREAMDDLLGDWTEETPVGLMAYGHRRRGDCTDIEVISPPRSGNGASVAEAVAGITPTGRTPLTDAVRQAAETLSFTDRPATVVLISDGVESCERDPCALAAELERRGVAFTAHVVGFGLGAEEDAGLACIAEETGGRYIAADDAATLSAALTTLSDTVAEAAAPEIRAVALEAPSRAYVGSDIALSWSGDIRPGDRVVLVPAATDDAGEDAGPGLQVGNARDGVLRAPSRRGDGGRFEARYLGDDQVLARAAVRLRNPDITVTAPATATFGTQIDVGWTGAVADDDYVALVPAEVGRGRVDTHLRTGATGDGSGTLVAPADPGAYELRYVLAARDRVMARMAVEVTGSTVEITAPATATAGSVIPLGWSDVISEADFITVVPADSDEDTIGEHLRTRTDREGRLQLPGTTGLYEARYVLEEGRRTIGRATIELTEPEATVTAPLTALVGSVIDVLWSGTVAENDFITIVPAGSDPGTIAEHIRTRDDTEGRLQVPGTPGLYEVRYTLESGRRPVATAQIELLEPETTVSAPATATVGSFIDVSWTGTVAENDFITIVPAGSDPGTIAEHIRTRDDTEGRLQVPGTPGLYEVRYTLEPGRRPVATAQIELLEPETTVSAPATATVGSFIDVSWTGTVAENDFITIVPAGSDPGTIAEHIRTRDDTEGRLQVPGTPGLYEVRYTLESGRRPVATAQIELLEPETTVSAPATATVGSFIGVSWTGTVAENDFITIVPAGADPGEISNPHLRTRDATQGRLQVPGTPGLYEVRYTLESGRRPVATAQVELTEPQTTILAPEVAVAGSFIDIEWTGTVAENDFITILPAGADPDEIGNPHLRTRDATAGELQTPGTPGLYEVRYTLEAGRRPVATAQIELMQPDVGITAPETVRAGDQMTVGWTGTVAPNDFITIVPADTPRDDVGLNARTGTNIETRFQAPETPGLYEARYVLASYITVAAAPFEVVAADAALSMGGALDAPGAAPAGSTVDVGWEGPAVAGLRLTLAVDGAPDFTWLGSATIAGGSGTAQIALPDEPGAYELRLLDLPNQAVLARRMIAAE